MNGPQPRRGGRSRHSSCLRWSERWGIFPQHSGGQYGLSPWMATKGRDPNSHWQIATHDDRSLQIGTGCVTATVGQLPLAKFLKQYPPRPYCRRSAGGSDYPAAELEPVTSADGLMCLNEVPEHAPRGTPRRFEDDDAGENCHLWVIDERGRPCISEAPLARLGPGKLHHTNLTGGGQGVDRGRNLVWHVAPDISIRLIRPISA